MNNKLREKFQPSPEWSSRKDVCKLAPQRTDETPTIASHADVRFPRQIPAGPTRCRLSLLPVANKQICLSLGIQLHFRLGEDRAAAVVAQGNNHGPLRVVVRSRRSDKGNLRCTLVLPLSSLIPISCFSPSHFPALFSFSLSPCDNPVASFSHLYRSLFSPSFHALFLHPSLSSFSCDFLFYSSSFYLSVLEDIFLVGKFRQKCGSYSIENYFFNFISFKVRYFFFQLEFFSVFLNINFLSLSHFRHIL